MRAIHGPLALLTRTWVIPRLATCCRAASGPRYSPVEATTASCLLSLDGRSAAAAWCGWWCCCNAQGLRGRHRSITTHLWPLPEPVRQLLSHILLLLWSFCRCLLSTGSVVSREKLAVMRLRQNVSMRILIHTLCAALRLLSLLSLFMASMHKFPCTDVFPCHRKTEDKGGTSKCPHCW